jgi:hypothetical protein
MGGIFRWKDKQPLNWYSRSLKRSNQYCLYCGTFVGDGSTGASDKEHLIGREFVPTGEFGDGSLFNFIFRACQKCNGGKCDLERHVSTVTLYKSPARTKSKRHDSIACRKASKDYHPDKKGTLIEDSWESRDVTTHRSGIRMTFGLTAPPQEKLDYVRLLAFRHIQGLFSLITSRDPLSEEGTSLLSGEFFHFGGAYNYGDWGNPQLVTIANRSQDIPCWANISTANGFFQAIMRRNVGQSGEWFWALEWNKSLRVVGAISLPDRTAEILSDLPELAWNETESEGFVKTRMRPEVPLDEQHDCLFCGEVNQTEDV